MAHCSVNLTRTVGFGRSPCQKRERYHFNKLPFGISCALAPEEDGRSGVSGGWCVGVWWLDQTEKSMMHDCSHSWNDLRKQRSVYFTRGVWNPQSRDWNGQYTCWPWEDICNLQYGTTPVWIRSPEIHGVSEPTGKTFLPNCQNQSPIEGNIV